MKASGCFKMGMNRPSGATDVLAEIAIRAREARDVLGLFAPPPPVLPDIRLPGPEEGNAGSFAPRPRPTPESLALDLDAEREAMEPFLSMQCPAVPPGRPVIRMPEADWRLEPSGEWTRVPLPHYGGPIGRARAWYRMKVTLAEEHFAAGTLWVCFGGADYKAAVFFNGELAGTHEGFFSPFEFEITSSARIGDNEMLVRIDNDAICMGNSTWGDPRTGDKIYGATGLGWDEPGLGWHHCPPGMGIHRPVTIESRPRLHVADVFVRPDPARESAEVWVEIMNTAPGPAEFALEVTIHPQNFAGSPFPAVLVQGPPAETGRNRYRAVVSLPGARLWSPKSPWLYRAYASLECSGGTDVRTAQFGMRSFVLDETPDSTGQRGRFMLNGEPIRLRGANTMGNEQLCVFRGALDQLRDDILLARLCHLNFLRFTQRPVEPEVYELCDRLGMMVQTDLPLFAYIRRNQFCEAVRQASEMERLIRSHASCVLVTFINEPFPAAWHDMSHRHLDRDELESFFEAATRAIRIENPDRQIKPIDGDYEPPGPGLPDNHCYAAWYNGHGLDLGMIHRGFWIAVKPGWNYACGEFGAEGLEDFDHMLANYPAEWLPAQGDPIADWSPREIFRAQTGTHHYLWIEPGRTPDEWITRSQAHQAWATRLLTEAFRRDNRMVSFAIHLFIDAWPAGWMKSILDCRRHPKPAFFAYQNALAPLAVNVRTNRTAYFAGEEVEVEVWVCNDEPASPSTVRLAYQLERSGQTALSGVTKAVIHPNEATFQGRLIFRLPQVRERERQTVRIGLLAECGSALHDTELELDVFSPLPPSPQPSRVEFVGDDTGVNDLASLIRSTRGPDVLIATDSAALTRRGTELESRVRAGAIALILDVPPGELSLGGSALRFERAGMEPRHFVSRAPGHPVARRFQENDFRFWDDPALDRPSPLLETLFFADGTWTPILNTGQGGWGQEWEAALAVAEKPCGTGKWVVCQVKLAGRLSNPVAKLFVLGVTGRLDREIELTGSGGAKTDPAS